MRVEVRRVLDLDKPIKVEELKPLERIIVAFRVRYRSSKLYKGKIERETRIKEEKEMKLKENVKSMILYRIQNSFKDKPNVKSIVLELSREYEDILDDILSSVDFMSLNMKVIPEKPDFLLSFPNLPILLEVSLK